jgi:hypothetical protein
MERSDSSRQGRDAAEPPEITLPALESDDAPRRWGHLERLERIGSGGFGGVFRAWEPSLQRHVALKLESRSRSGSQQTDAHVSQFLAEGRRLARVRHPNLVSVYGAEEHDGRAGIWMELIEGLTLKQLVQRQGPFHDREAALIVADVCRALCAIHRAGIIHRDVSANNVMRETGGRIVLMDLGLGIEANEAHPPAPESVVGTPSYIAPEVLDGGPATAVSDLYALGVLLFFLLTGTYPFATDSLEDIVRAHAERRYRLVHELRPDLPAAIAQLLDRATAADPAQRYRSAAEMETALAVATRADASAGPALEGGEPARASRSRVALLAGGGLAVVAVTGLALGGAGLWRDTGAGAGGAPYRIAAGFYRNDGDELQRLRSGDVVSPGEAICMEVQSSDSLYIYVVNRDERDQTFLLFPTAGGIPGNPLPPGRHRLPGQLAGEPLDWEVTSVGGKETYFVVASRTRPLELEIELFSLPRPVAGGPPGDLAAERGTGGLVRSRTAGARLRRVLDAASELPVEEEQNSGLWSRRLQLANPATPG